MKAAVEIENRFAILPNGNGGAQFVELLEILPKQRFHSLAKLVWA